MDTRDYSRESTDLTSAIEEVLPKTDDIFQKIRAFKMAKMEQFLSGEHACAVFERGPSGAITSRWPIVLLEDIAVSDQGIVQGPEDLSIYQDYYSHDGLPIMEAGFLIELRFQAEEYQYLRHEIGHAFEHYVVHGADILMVQEGQYVGSSTVVPIHHHSGMLGSRCIRIRVNSEICETFYLINVLHYYYHTGILKTLHEGSDSRRITLDSLKSLTIPLAPMQDQSRITDLLLNLSGAMVAQETYKESLMGLRKMIGPFQPL